MVAGSSAATLQTDWTGITGVRMVTKKNNAGQAPKSKVWPKNQKNLINKIAMDKETLHKIRKSF